MLKTKIGTNLLGVENKLKFGVIVAFVGGIVGTLSFTILQTSVDSPTLFSQSVDVGANVLVEIIHEDGTKDTWEGHNSLTNETMNFLVACITGLDTTPFEHDDCVFNADDVRLWTSTNFSAAVLSDPVQGNISLMPQGCNLDGGVPCTGWNITAVFDFIDLECTQVQQDCPLLVAVSSSDGTNTLFNNFSVNPEQEILPNDRVLVSMDIDVTS